MSGWFLLLWPILIALIQTSSDKTDGVLAMAEIAFEAILMMVPGTAAPNGLWAGAVPLSRPLPRTHRLPT